MTFSGSAEEIARKAFGLLLRSLQRHHQVIDLSGGDEPRIAAALDWLELVCHPDGYWGYRSPAVTATCAEAITLWRPGIAERALRTTADWLLAQSGDGLWETVWDSAVAVAAISRCGLGGDPRARRAMDRLAAMPPSACMGKPHHAAQVLNAAEALDLDLRTRAAWEQQVRSDLETRRGAYVVGQAVHALISCGRPVDEVADELDFLATCLQETPLSTAAFLDHAAALRALAIAGSHPDVVDRAVDELFHSAYRRDGSWYHEPWYTAWALLALHEAKAVRRIVVEQPRLNEYFAGCESSVKQIGEAERRQAKVELRRRWRVVMGVVLLELSVFGVLAAVYLLPERSRLFTSGLAVSSVLAVVAVAGKLLRPLLGRPARS